MGYLDDDSEGEAFTESLGTTAQEKNLGDNSRNSPKRDLETGNQADEPGGSGSQTAVTVRMWPSGLAWGGLGVLGVFVFMVGWMIGATMPENQSSATDTTAVEGRGTPKGTSSAENPPTDPENEEAKPNTADNPAAGNQGGLVDAAAQQTLVAVGESFLREIEALGLLDQSEVGVDQVSVAVGDLPENVEANLVAAGTWELVDLNTNLYVCVRIKNKSVEKNQCQA